MSSRTAGYEGRFDVFGWYLIRQVVRLRSTLPRSPPSLIDLGMGRGRDLIYFARRGFRALGVDRSPGGMAQAHRRAARLRVPFRTELADRRTYRAKRKFDVVFSSCALNYLPRELRARRIADFQAATAPEGVHAVNAFTSGTDRMPVPDVDPDSIPFRTGELRGYYRDWQVLDSRELRSGCAFGGRPHRHVVDVVIARRPN